MFAHVQEYNLAMAFLADVVEDHEPDEAEDAYWNDAEALERAADEHEYYKGFIK